MQQLTAKKSSINSIKKLSTAIASLMVLTACQTTTGLDINKAETLANASQQALSPEHAKDQLQQALKNQVTTSFDFQTFSKLANGKRLDALNKATPAQLASSQDKANYCKDRHDRAYIALLKDAEQAGQSIFDSEFATTKQTLKNVYLNCYVKYEEMQDTYYYGDDKEYLPDYDTNHTLADKNKAVALDKFLLQPLNLSISGSYRPLKGIATALPVVSFEQRNFYISMQQPFYIDAKKGNLYLWAETFAPLVSKLVDNELGADWKDKWFVVSLQDGSLPKGIEKSLVESMIAAKHEALKEEPAALFSYVDGADVLKSLPYLSTNHEKVISNTGQIISRSHSKLTMAKQNYLMQRSFYELMTEKHPQVFAEDETKIEADKASRVLNSKKVLQMLLDLTRKSVANYETKAIASLDISSALDSDEVINQEHFGLQNNQLLWSHKRFNLPSKKNPTEPMYVDSLTMFTKVNPLSPVVLDKVSTPNAENSIDLLGYINVLVDRNLEDATSNTMKLFQTILPTATKQYDTYMAEAKAAKDTTDSEAEPATDLSNDEAAESVTSTSTVQNDAQSEDVSDGLNKEHGESAQCVLMSISIEDMCLPEYMQQTGVNALAECKKEQEELSDIYNEYCK